MIPIVIEKGTGGERALDIYSRLLEDRIVYVSGPITPEKSDLIIAQLLFLDNGEHTTIRVYIDTPGGDVPSGLAVYDTMKLIKSPIETISLGLCASMGVILALGGDKRYALPHTTFMMHQPWVPGSKEMDAVSLEIQAKQLKSFREKVCKIIADATGKDMETIYKDTDRDFYLDADHALRYGLIDGVIMGNGIAVIDKTNKDEQKAKPKPKPKKSK